jgi:hypothetical protein
MLLSQPQMGRGGSCCHMSWCCCWPARCGHCVWNCYLQCHHLVVDVPHQSSLLLLLLLLLRGCCHRQSLARHCHSGLLGVPAGQHHPGALPVAAGEADPGQGRPHCLQLPQTHSRQLPARVGRQVTQVTQEIQLFHNAVVLWPDHNACHCASTRQAPLMPHPAIHSTVPFCRCVGVLIRCQGIMTITNIPAAGRPAWHGGTVPGGH